MHFIAALLSFCNVKFQILMKKIRQFTSGTYNKNQPHTKMSESSILISSAIPSENFQQTGRDENHSYCLRPLVEVPDIKKKSSLNYSSFKRDFEINEYIKSTSAKIVTFRTVFESFL